MTTAETISLQQAVRSAKSFLTGIDPDDEHLDLRVEEVDRNEADDWEITLGFYRPRDAAFSGPGLLFKGANSQFAREDRVYKKVVVDHVSGEALKVKIREVTV